MTSQEFIESNQRVMLSRKDCIAYIKNVPELKQSIYNEMGINYTNVKTEDLRKCIRIYLAEEEGYTENNSSKQSFWTIIKNIFKQ